AFTVREWRTWLSQTAPCGWLPSERSIGTSSDASVSGVMAKLWGTTKMSVLIPHLGWLMALTAVAAAGCGSSAAPPSAAAEGSAAINPFPPGKVDPKTDRLGDSYFYGRVVINETLPPNGSVSVCMVPKDALQESSGQAMVQPDAVGGRVTPVD